MQATKIKKYDTYKDSGIEWIGEIPQEWDLTRLKQHYQFEKGKNAALYTNEYIGLNEGEYPVYSGQTENNGIMGHVNTFDYDESICVFTTTVGAKVMSPKILSGKFCLSQNCLIMKKIGTVDERFLYYQLLPLFDYEKSLIPSYMQPSLRIADLKRYVIISCEEQQQIAEYLDKKCGEIDKVVEAEKSVIEKLKEYKQSIITEAVTKGLDKSVPLKNSGIEWIGKIPQHWEVRKLKTICKPKGIKNKPNETVLSLYRDLGIVIKSSRDDNFNVTSEDTTNYKFVEVNDLVVNKMKAWQGSIAISNFQGIVSPAYYVNEITYKNIYPFYLHYLLRNHSYLPEYRRLSEGIRPGQWDLSYEAFRNIPIVIPNYNEQQQIAEYLDKKCSKIDKAIADKEQLIEKFTEYKKSLIYECVTGKRKVVA